MADENLTRLIALAGMVRDRDLAALARARRAVSDAFAAMAGIDSQIAAVREQAALAADPGLAAAADRFVLGSLVRRAAAAEAIAAAQRAEAMARTGAERAAGRADALDTLWQRLTTGRRREAARRQEGSGPASSGQP